LVRLVLSIVVGGFVGGGVVWSAEEGEVAEGGVASVCPVDQVVGVAPCCGCVTAVPRTAAVSLFEGSADACGDGACFASDVEWF
jgi:hypothetical protein